MKTRNSRPLTLPLEIWSRVANQLDNVKDYLRLRSTCQSLRKVKKDYVELTLQTAAAMPWLTANWGAFCGLSLQFPMFSPSWTPPRSASNLTALTHLAIERSNVTLCVSNEFAAWLGYVISHCSSLRYLRLIRLGTFCVPPLQILEHLSISSNSCSDSTFMPLQHLHGLRTPGADQSQRAGGSMPTLGPDWAYPLDKHMLSRSAASCGQAAGAVHLSCRMQFFITGRSHLF